MKVLAHRLGLLMRRQVLCRLGVHGDAKLMNVCLCGKQLNPGAYKRWRVTMTTGEVHVVVATNEAHARSMVVHGGTLTPRAAVKNHPDNIAAVCLAD